MLTFLGVMLKGSVHLAEIKFRSVLTTRLTRERRAARRRGTEAGGTQHGATRTREIARGDCPRAAARRSSRVRRVLTRGCHERQPAATPLYNMGTF